MEGQADTHRSQPFRFLLKFPLLPFPTRGVAARGYPDIEVLDASRGVVFIVDVDVVAKRIWRRRRRRKSRRGRRRRRRRRRRRGRWRRRTARRRPENESLCRGIATGVFADCDRGPYYNLQFL
jgi:hypothetical protein